MNPTEPPLSVVTRDGLVLRLHVQPRASKCELCGIQNSALKVRLTSPPVDGAANKLCREFLARLFSLPVSAVELLSGETSRHKRLLLRHHNPQYLATRLDELIAPPTTGVTDTR